MSLDDNAEAERTSDTDEFDASARFHALANRLMDRIIPVPLSVATFAAALASEHPVWILILWAITMRLHFRISKQIYHYAETRDPRLERMPLVRLGVASTQTLATYLLAGAAANAWYPAAPIILDFSKIEADKLLLDRTPFQPALVGKHCLEVMRSLAESKSLQLELDISDSVPEWLSGDEVSRIPAWESVQIRSRLSSSHSSKAILRPATASAVPGSVFRSARGSPT